MVFPLLKLIKMDKKSFLWIGLLVLLYGCYGSNNIYKAEKTKGVEFKKYKTYAFSPTKDTAYTSMVNRKNLEINLANAVMKELSKRGMTLDTLHPDCIFTYTLVMQKTYDVGQRPPEVYNQQAYAPVYPGQANVYYYIPANVTPTYTGGMMVTTFRDGSLVIDMIDRQDNKVVWRTSAQGKQEESEAKGVRANITEIVPQMFKKFPVKG
jgi:hypothetical protein